MSDEKVVADTEVAIVDSTEVETVFVDGIHGLQLRDGVVSINMTRYTFPAPKSNLKDPLNQVVLRMAIPAPAFVRFAEWFQQTKQKMVDDGAIVIHEQEDDAE